MVEMRVFGFAAVTHAHRCVCASFLNVVCKLANVQKAALQVSLNQNGGCVSVNFNIYYVKAIFCRYRAMKSEATVHRV